MERTSNISALLNVLSKMALGEEQNHRGNNRNATKKIVVHMEHHGITIT